MNVIVAVDENWGIGKNNDLLFRLPLDMKHFREMTTGKVILMGGNTLLSFPNSKPLPNRTNLVLSDVFTRDDCKVYSTLKEMLEALKEYDPDELFVVGGAMFYRTMLPYCKKAYITKVEANGEATHFFPNLDKEEGWELRKEEDKLETGGYTIRFTEYENECPKAI